MQNYLDLLARILISILFLINGYFKIINYEGTIEWMENYNIASFFNSCDNFRDNCADINNYRL